MKTSRYPGVAPFESHQSYIFAGRDRDTHDLYKLIRLEKQILLYSKSGVGKSSLVNAGVLPLLQQDANFETLRIRFFAHTKDTPRPVKTVLEQLKANGFDNKSQAAQEIADLAAPRKESLWKYFKTLQLAELETGAAKTFLLIFDQFEELFSYPEDEILEFKSQLADVLQGDLPQDCVDDVAQARKSRADLFSRSIIAQLHKSLNVKVLFIIRSDRLHLLNALTDYLPNIQQTYYELKPLNAKQAGDAINEPAKIAQAEGQFISPAYKVSNAALLRIMRDLTDKFENDVETTQLQIVCQKLESIAMEKQQAGKLPEAFELTPGDLPDFKGIFLKFYEDTIAKLPANQQTAARLLIEDGLIRNKQRISLDKNICTDDYHLTEVTLNQLVEHHLLRSEQNTTKGYNYELAHDTLVAPIQDAADKRHEAEEKERQLRIKNEELRIEREKQKKQRRTFAFVLALALLFLGIGIFGIVMWKTAERQTAIASQQTIEAQTQKGIANDKATKLKQEQKKLQKALKDAEEAKDTAEAEKIKAQLATNLAEQKRLEAEQFANGLMPEEAKKDQFAYFWKKGKQSLNELRYAQAYNEILMAKRASNQPNDKKDSVNNLFKEISWLYEKYKKATALFYDPEPSTIKFTEAKKLFYEIHDRNPKDSLSWFLGKACADLRTEDMVLINGGTFERVDEDHGSTKQTVSLNPYHIAKYEVSHAQYARFLNQFSAKYKNQKEYLDSIQNSFIVLTGYKSTEMKFGIYLENGIYKVSLGYENRPIAWVSWYGADAFCRFYQIRLPTEAQWEFAARGGEDHIFAGSDSIDEVAWYGQNSNDKTHPSGLKKQNKYGLYDMAGNLWEWCWDWHDAYGEGSVSNPQGPLKGSSRMLRGGSSYNYAIFCRIVNRNNYTPNDRNYDGGFRVVSLGF